MDTISHYGEKTHIYDCEVRVYMEEIAESCLTPCGIDIAELNLNNNDINAFNKTTKIGVYKELHKRGLICDWELMTLIERQGGLSY